MYVLVHENTNGCEIELYADALGWHMECERTHVEFVLFDTEHKVCVAHLCYKHALDVLRLQPEGDWY